MKKIVVAFFVLLFVSNQAFAAIINPFLEKNTYFSHTKTQYANSNLQYSKEQSKNRDDILSTTKNKLFGLKISTLSQSKKLASSNDKAKKVKQKKVKKNNFSYSWNNKDEFLLPVENDNFLVHSNLFNLRKKQKLKFIGLALRQFRHMAI
jgi:hypothetical protein